MTEKIELTLSKKQVEFLTNWTNSWQVASGSIRSGKTFPQLLKFKYFLEEKASIGVKVIISGRTGDSVERNIVDEFLTMANMMGVGADYEYTRQPRVLTYKPKNVHCWVVGGNDESAEERLRGMTAQAWVCDEGTTHPRSFFFECMARTSYGARWKFITTNPDAPTHWFKTRFMDSTKIDIANYFFEFKDNPSLSKEYVDELYATYSGIDFERKILGRWVADSASLIMRDFSDENVRDVERPVYCKKLVSMDVGYNDFTALCYGWYDFSKQISYIEDSSFIRMPSSLDIAEEVFKKEESLWKQERPYKRVSDVDKILLKDLYELHGLQFSETKKDHKQAQINALNIAFKTKKCFIHPRNEKLIYQLKTGTYESDVKVNPDGKEMTRKFSRTDEEGHFDGIDAAIYFYRNVPKFINPVPNTTYHFSDNLFINPYLLMRDNNLEVSVMREALIGKK